MTRRRAVSILRFGHLGVVFQFGRVAEIVLIILN